MYKKVIKTVVTYTAILTIGALIGYVAVNLPRWAKPSFTEGDFSAHYASSKTNIVLYGTQSCQYCKATRSFLRDKKIDFTDLDVQFDVAAQKKFAEFGVKSVPVILIGQRRIDGFKPNIIEDALLLLKK